MPLPEALREAIRAQALPAAPNADALVVARGVAERGGPSVLGLVFFGSRKTQAGFNPWSAFDLFVLTADYRSFYRSLRAAGSLRRSPGLVALLNAWMPPNQVSIMVPGDGGVRRAKCSVISLESLERETSKRRRDHFCIGRMFQPTELLFARDGAAQDRILAALASAHALTLAWVRPWLPATFDVDVYTQTLLRVSLGREIRPEPTGRADALWQAQKENLRRVYTVMLREAVQAGDLVSSQPGVFALARPVTGWERLRTTFYFRRSLVRATLRWAKYMFTFDDWLEYIVRKVERHSGESIALTPREKWLPIVFLWPRVFRYLKHKDGKA